LFRRPVTALFAAQNSRSSLGTYTMHPTFAPSLVDRYDAFILDQFGVMHNGVEALDGAVELCEHLYQKDKKLIILSNTSAPSDKALMKLPKLGFDADLFVGAVTSGEEASRYIRNEYNKENAASGYTNVLMITWDTLDANNPRLTAMPEAFLEKCGPNIRLANSVEDADLLLLHGSEVWWKADGTQSDLGGFIETGRFDALDTLLKQCVEKRLPCICANPDIIVQTPTGGVAYMPGKIAQRYRELGGDTRIFGKPQVEHFDACIKTLKLPRDRVAHVGDSLHHDIAGAAAAGIANVFVTSGIHRLDLCTEFAELPDRSILDDLFDREGGIVPTHVVPAFRL
jgi:HAD superfamily hydrolase (TIGR01459 family)